MAESRDELGPRWSIELDGRVVTGEAEVTAFLSTLSPADRKRAIAINVNGFRTLLSKLDAADGDDFPFKYAKDGSLLI